MVLSLSLCSTPFTVSSGAEVLREGAPRDSRAPVFIAPRGWLELRALGSKVALALEGDVSRLFHGDARRLLIDAGARLFIPSRWDLGLALRLLTVGDVGAEGFLPKVRFSGFELRLRANL